MTTTTTPRLLTIEQVMRELHIGRTTVYTLINSGSFPRPVKIGKGSRWLRDELDEWVEAQAAARSA